ncbi:MAG TPA: hypothetical protein VKE41_06015 [Roseiflexaceae bacterium]|nr:hypothetical protein [Roseiflexaceae bacterium]
MKSRNRIFAVVLALLFVLALTACGGGAPASLSDIPTYPNAVALKPGENPMADTLAKNVQQAGAMGAKLDQKIFTLPKDASWDQIKGFYSEKLTSAGWSSTSLPIPDNDMFKMTVWTKGGQSLTVGQLTEPVSKDSFLLFSLATQ